MQNKNASLAQASNRREFVRTSAGIAALGCTTLAVEAQAAVEAASTDKVCSDAVQAGIVRAGDTVLFQGDSITDAGRDRKLTTESNRQKPFGKGYAWLAAAGLLVNRPDDKIKAFNRGISGNKVHQLAERWQADCLDLQPNVLSILIGVNDLWHALDGHFDGTVESYEKDYHALVKRTQVALPNVRLVICEPFVLRCGKVDEKWFPLFNDYRAAARRVSDRAGATFVPFQSMFDRATKLAPPSHWAGDGVHPSSAGAALMAQCWLNAVGA